jgi:predicted small lipoprotein YifL
MTSLLPSIVARWLAAGALVVCVTACGDAGPRGARDSDVEAADVDADSEDTGSGEAGVDAEASPDADADADGDEAGEDARPPPALHVLFLGNSYTFVNDLPGQVQALVASGATPLEITVDSVTEAGATLMRLYEGTEALARVREGGWTHVVIQGQSTEAVWPIADPAAFQEYARRFGEEANAVGAVPVYYETWARQAGDPVYELTGLTPATMQAALRDAYRQAAESVGGSVAPAGDAWELELAEPSPLGLFQSDGSHPTPRGTYLTGCVFFNVLTQRSALGLGGVPPEVTADDAAHLQAIADRATGH